YMKERNDVSINLKMANTEDIVSMVEEGEIDLGLIEGNTSSSRVKQEIISPDELIVVSSNKNLTHEHYIDTLIHKKWILREKGSGTRSVFLDQIKPIDKELNIVLALEHTEAIKNFLILDDSYISCLPRISIANELKEKKLFHIPIKNHTFSRDFSLVYNKKRSPTLLMEDFKKYIFNFMS
ncbi:MAG TPA: LysR family transcriptional regulator, partial [Sulfurimonas sp.]|nr:LysR family transcriptional regulator [Sulfurimonas sp.]